jgi:CRISPR-associated protein Cmr4
MFEKSAMIYLYVETPLHVGTGSGLGAVDLPIQRERATGYPMVQASSLKGALRAIALRLRPNERNKIEVIFGPEPSHASDHAGAISPSDSRLLLFPVRSLLGVFAWTTSRDALMRFNRDAIAAKILPDWGKDKDCNQLFPNWPNGENDALITSDKCDLVPSEGDWSKAKPLVLEEFAFNALPDQSLATFAEWLAKNAFPQGPEYDYWRLKLPRSLVVLPENAFRDFVSHATEVVTRVRLDQNTKTVARGALWTEEYLPTDTMLYAPLYSSAPRKKGVIQPDTADGVLQFVQNLNLDRMHLGGDETVGRGLVKVKLEMAKIAAGGN